MLKNNVRYLDSTHLFDERLFFDSCSVSFFRLSLYQGLAFEQDVLSGHFQNLCTRMFEGDANEFCRYRSRFFYFFFYGHFLEDFSLFLQHQAKPLRSSWLLKSCQAIDLSDLDAKASKHYFKQLEQNFLVNKVSALPTPSSFLKSEYQRLQIQYFFSIIKKNIPFFLFWILAFFVFYICLFIAAKENSFTILDQIKAWYQFVMQRS